MKGKAKRTRSDDVPPESSPEMKHQQECLLDLRRHLRCSAHSIPGRPVYCWPELAGKDSLGGHRELTHEEMTLWAKHIVSQIKWSVRERTLYIQLVVNWQGNKVLAAQDPKVQSSACKKAKDCECESRGAHCPQLRCDTKRRTVNICNTESDNHTISRRTHLGTDASHGRE